ncbi:V-type ATP synthase subunit I [Clostridium sp. CF011]|uniref:V-type ATP synthase subunit I n=1 Tax=unclassified Clostridium TaxID=2614128 RepID=UPI001C0C35AB|nr:MULTISPECIES: V-type ATP synthase subunit I [unclassified Clostridium]MBU3090610.1 V-type ATP synthase subunit I [Clostridium sp. CF011]MBW9144391.1 V-type ATP synthase subunit I [Clostridium sp. CM027]UVE40980.1 V-type ATP synthase subunit I [Clostridium sp. CM027]WAG69962.1 V-type ATP synthase subunit I [Clostridium sp. CF011]
MAIVKMSKFTLFAFESQKEALLDNFHKFENIQFVNLQESAEEDLQSLVKDSENEKVSHLEGEQAKVKFALDLLMKHSEKEGALKSLIKGKSSLDYEELETLAKKSNYKENYQKLKDRDNNLIQMKSEKAKINSEIGSLTPWISLDASFKDLKSLNSSIFLMGSLPKAFKDAFREEFESKIPCSYLEVISDGKNAINVIALVYKEYEDKASEILKHYSFNTTNLKYDGISAEIVREFNKRLDEISKEEEKINAEIKNDCQYLEDFKIVYEYLSNKHIKASACKNFLKTENTVAIEGWVPTESAKDLENLIKSTTKEEFYLEIEKAVKEDDRVPILLKNSAVVEPFELIVSMYSLPKYSEIDPTPVMAPFYMVFFGMMLADLGYGLVMFIACAIALKKFNLEEGQKKFAKFFLLLSIPTALAGVVYGGFFGDIIPFISTHSLINPGEDIMLLLIISIVIGAIQIYFGLGVKGYMLIRDGKPMDAIYDVVTWYAALTGAFLLLGGAQIGLSPAVVNIGKWVMIVGMVALVLTQGRQNKGIGAKLGGGLYGLYGISSYIGDLVSYSRIMALGLAGGFIASAFNMLIKMMPTPFNIIIGIFIFVFAQTFNLLLSSLSAFVHSARLQYVEYFSKFYEGGGKAFKVFKSKNQYINVIKGKQI